jgi:hypothetical protein
MKRVAEPSRGTGINDTLRREIIANEAAVWEAAKTKDMGKFAQLVAEDAHMIFSSGVMSRSEYIDSASERVISEYALSDFDVYMAAPNAVITIYKATVSGVFGGVRVDRVTVREASVWILRSHRWMAVLNQETPKTEMP